jgi:16S rRNA (guanine527-N7)-methyltransferase
LKGLDQEFLAQEAERFGVALGPIQLQQFSRYHRELKAWNKKINLTSLEDDLDILIKHFIDSLLPLRFIPQCATLLDIGSGAGFPGIPLKIAAPSLQITLLDSTLKKVFFQRHIIRTLGLRGIEAVHGRAEELGERGGAFLYDVVISRALYSFVKLQQVGKGYLKQGGRLIVITTPQRVCEAEKELREGLRWQESENVILPLNRGRRKIILLEKT